MSYEDNLERVRSEVGRVFFGKNDDGRPYVSVRQARAFHMGEGSAFESYWQSHGYGESRSYACHVGLTSVEKLNDKFSRVVIPMSSANDHYGVIRIPNDQIYVSPYRSSKGTICYDIDLGLNSQKHEVTYNDKDGNRCSEYLPSKHIERYMNFSASAYLSGRDNSPSAYGCDSIRERYPLVSCFDNRGKCANYRVNSSFGSEVVKAFKERYSDVNGDFDTVKFETDAGAFTDDYRKFVEDAVDYTLKNRTVYDSVRCKDDSLEIFKRGYIDGCVDEVSTNYGRTVKAVLEHDTEFFKDCPAFCDVMHDAFGLELRPEGEQYGHASDMNGYVAIPDEDIRAVNEMFNDTPTDGDTYLPF